MSLVFISNYFNHHQLPISDALYELLNGNFYFICTGSMSDERKRLGYESLSKKYVLNYNDHRSQCDHYISHSDCVIIGSAPDFLIKNRLNSGKLVFRYSERPLKKGFEIYKYLYRFIKWHLLNKKKYNVYMLCASAYTAPDYAKFGLFKNRCFKWGYFPKAKKYDCINDLIEKKQKNSILWVGRFLDWKHPELPVLIAKRLKQDGYAFSLKMIGVGVEKDKTEALVKKLNLEDRVEFLGAMPPEEVRRYMEESEIFLFTSDRREGWGAVLNEAMNSGCAVVADKKIGSVPYLIKDCVNGFTYNGSLDDLYIKTKLLLDCTDLAKQFGLKSYEIINETWNSQIAAERFLKLIDYINDRQEVSFIDGPCSEA